MQNGAAYYEGEMLCWLIHVSYRNGCVVCVLVRIFRTHTPHRFSSFYSMRFSVSSAFVLISDCVTNLTVAAVSTARWYSIDWNWWGFENESEESILHYRKVIFIFNFFHSTLSIPLTFDKFLNKKLFLIPF